MCVCEGIITQITFHCYTKFANVGPMSEDFVNHYSGCIYISVFCHCWDNDGFFGKIMAVSNNRGFGGNLVKSIVVCLIIRFSELTISNYLPNNFGHRNNFSLSVQK